QGDCYCPPPFTAQVHAGCGWVNGAWNVPYGALVLVRSSGGPIAAVIDAIGEYYTHSALSFGEQGIAQSEMKVPDQNSWPAGCTLPARPDQLRDGYPGVEQVNLAAAFADLASGGAALRYKYRDPRVMTNIANSMITTHPAA